MRLQIGPNIDNGRVRLDFRKSPDRPQSTPSYEIEQTKADEFVKNTIHKKKIVQYDYDFVAAFSMLGWITSIYKRSILWGILGIPGGVIAGLGVGAMISSNKKNNLMDKYNVKEVTKN